MSRPSDPKRRAQPSYRAQSRACRGGRAVVGVDGTAASLDALSYAVGWARRLRGQLDVLYVQDSSWSRVIDACAAVYPIGPDPGCETQISGFVGSAVGDLLAGTELAWRFHIASGAVAHALEAHADSIGADLIIVGSSHRRRGYRRSASTAHRLLSCAHRIVVVVP